MHFVSNGKKQCSYSKRCAIGCGVFPDIATFNTVLDALCKEGKTSEALGHVEEMIHRGLKPDHHPQLLN